MIRAGELGHESGPNVLAGADEPLHEPGVMLGIERTQIGAVQPLLQNFARNREPHRGLGVRTAECARQTCLDHLAATERLQPGGQGADPDPTLELQQHPADNISLPVEAGALSRDAPSFPL